MEMEAIKALFIDSESDTNYVPLRRNRVACSKLLNATKNPFRLILIHGRPGSGKSFLMQMFYEKNRDRFNIFLFKEPTFDAHRSLHMIYNRLSGNTLPETFPLDELLERIEEEIRDEIYILLDEAQLYDDRALEWIRILSNRPKFKFIISVHTMDKEDIWAREHFQTRTYETIELSLLNSEEVALYIEKKLLMASDLELATLFTRSNYRLIHKLTRGNLREINRLMNRTLDILEHRLDRARTLFGNKLKNKFIEMAALDLKMIHG